METENKKIKGGLSPVKEVITPIEKYENTMNGEGRRLIIDQILALKPALQQSLEELTKIG